MRCDVFISWSTFSGVHRILAALLSRTHRPDFLFCVAGLCVNFCSGLFAVAVVVLFSTYIMGYFLLFRERRLFTKKRCSCIRLRGRRELRLGWVVALQCSLSGRLRQARVMAKTLVAGALMNEGRV